MHFRSLDIYIYMIYPYSYGSHSDTSFWKRSCHAYTCEIIHTLSVPSFLRRVKVGFQGFAEAFPSWLRSMERIMHVRSTWMSTDQLAVLKRLNSPSQWQTDARYLPIYRIITAINRRRGFNSNSPLLDRGEFWRNYSSTNTFRSCRN